MKKVLIVAVMLLLVLGSSVPLAVLGISSIQQTTTGCPTYQTNLVVDFVDSTPIDAVVGITIVTRVHVVYPDGTPVALLPETISFLWTGGAGQEEFDNVQVIFTGNPGWYNYTETVTADLLQATGQGKVTISVVTCSASDGLGNRGPTGLISSDTTFTPGDNSILNIGPQVTPPSQPFSWLVPLLIAILLIIALLLFLLRGRKKRK